MDGTLNEDTTNKAAAAMVPAPTADGGVDGTKQSSVVPPTPPTQGGEGGEDGTALPKDNPFDQYYSQLTHQQNMLQDSARVTAYQRAILENAADFKGKVVLDVGTGSGILAFFAAQAGARRVYAVEASDVAEAAQQLVEANHMSSIIKVVKGKVEEIELPEKVDVIVSEPIGFLLVHERMLECYVKARDRFLKPGGKMLPTIGEIVAAPITDETLHQEQGLKASFWESQSYYGVDLSVLREKALAEHYGQPVVGYFYPTSIISNDRGTHSVNFSTVSAEELIKFTVPLRFSVAKTSLCHGLGCWFDLTFSGSESIVTLSTAPEAPQTHWYQCRLMLETPLAVNATQVVTGELLFEANEKHSYFITMTLRLEGTEISSRQRINLQDQMYHYLTSPQSAGQV
eukprot:g6094.t1